MNIVNFVFQHARYRSDRPAVVAAGVELDYAELAQIVRQEAEHLQSLGVSRRSQVMVCVMDDLDHLVILLALALLGAVSFSVDWRTKTSERRNVASALKPDLALFTRNAGAIADFPSFNVDGAWKEMRSSFQGAIEPVVLGWDTPLFIMLTSGTTATPKGVVITHGQWFMRTVPYRYTLGLGDGHRYFSVLPLSFTMGKEHIFHHILTGNTGVFYPPMFTPDEYIEAVHRFAATAAALVPSIVRQLLTLPGGAEPLMPMVQSLDISGAPITPEEKIHALRKLTPNVYVSYGATGSGKISTQGADEIEFRAEGAGLPVAGILLEVVDDDGFCLPHGVTGLVRCKGGAIATGITAGHQKTDEAFQDGWYYTGDIGLLDESGRLFLRGRVSGIIISGGINVYPEEIQEVIGGHPNVEDVAVVGREGDTADEFIVAFIVARGALTEDELIGYCKARLASYKIPGSVVFVPALPRTASGKVEIKALKAMC